MADRTVRVVLQAVTQQFDAALQKAAGSAKNLQSNMEKAHEAGDFKALQGPLVAYGTAMTAVGAAVAKTGIEYNTLQQTSRAALTTLTGSAQAANAQMDKLDDFARTSPFGKDIFIRAQQQMLAFGVETEKVIPYLDALNDATAAAGGNGQQLGELAYIMAQISAAGKITAQDLMQFGQRGVNAAELIGDSMGKTGAQIRQSITDGTLDADQALDALAQGMSERFEGASANVKNTMEGAFDRVKAAWRDLSASIMEPAVSQSGGGFLVDATNSVADFLRGVEALPGPVKQAGSALGVLSGGAALAVAGLISVVPKINDAVLAARNLATAFPRITAAAGPVGLGIAAATTVIGIAVAEMGRHAGEVDAYIDALKQGGEEAEKSARELQAHALQVEGVASAMKDLGIQASVATEAALGDADARQRIVDAYEREIQLIGELIAAKQESGDATWLDDVEHQKMLGDEYQRVIGIIDERARISAEAHEAEKRQREEMAALMANDPEMQRKWGEAVKAYHTEGRGEIDSTTASVRELTEAEQEWLNTVVGASSGFIDHFDALETAQQQYAERAAVNAGKSADAWKEFAESGKFSLLDFAAALQEQVDAMNAWETNIIALHGKVSQSSIDALMEMANTNPQLAAQLAAEMVTATTDTLSELEPNLERVGEQSGKKLHDALTATVGDLDLAAVMGAAGAKGGDAMLQEVASKFQAGEATLGQIVAEYDLYAELGIDTTKFGQGAAEAKADAEADPATITIEADDDPASQTVGSLLAEIDGSTGTTTVDADTGPATHEVTDILAWVDRQRADVTVGADTSDAERAARAALSRISAMTANMSVTARVGVYHRNGFDAPMAQGGKVGDAVAAYQGMSDGGRVYGPGTTTSDEAALVALSHGEFVIREWAARAIGYDQLEHANNTGSLPTEHRMQATPAAYTVNYSVPQAEPQVTNHYHIQALEFPGVRVAAEMERAMDRLPELAQQRGVRRG